MLSNTELTITLIVDIMYLLSLRVGASPFRWILVYTHWYTRLEGVDRLTAEACRDPSQKGGIHHADRRRYHPDHIASPARAATRPVRYF